MLQFVCIFFFSKKHLWTLILNAPTQCFWSLRNCHEICCERLNDTSPPGLLLWNPLRTFSISISPVQAYGQWLTSIDTIAQGCPKPIAPSPSQDIQPIRAWDYQCNIPECGYLYHQKNPVGNPMVCTRMHSSTCFCEVFPPFQQLMGTCTIRCVS